MPEFVQENQNPWKSISLTVPNQEAVEDFKRRFETRPSGSSGTTFWYPYQPRQTLGSYVGGSLTTRYPIYIISKGRWESRQTARALERIGTPYRIVIEPQELEQYAAVIDREKILTLPFSNLGQGSIPARNWVWEHSLSEGHKRHWILDDNIMSFMRLNRNLKRRTFTAATFCAAEDFSDRYENLALSGFHYQWFVRHRDKVPPYYLNTRIYSCILIRNDLPYRWRGRYNEDTDLSLRVLKDGLCTVLFNAFLCDKSTTMVMKGGNTDELYAAEDGRLKMAESLVEQHPDVASVSWKFKRWQHHVNYKPFQENRLERREDVVIPEGVNEYGMTVQDAEPEAPPKVIEPEAKTVDEEASDFRQVDMAQLLKEEAWAEEWNQMVYARAKGHEQVNRSKADWHDLYGVK
jgi:hypothetical protein